MVIKIDSHGFIYSFCEYGAPLFAAFGRKGAPLLGKFFVSKPFLPENKRKKKFKPQARPSIIIMKIDRHYDMCSRNENKRNHGTPFNGLPNLECINHLLKKFPYCLKFNDKVIVVKGVSDVTKTSTES